MLLIDMHLIIIVDIHYTFHVGSIRADGGMVAFANERNGEIVQRRDS
jgi:hypothetical protein